MEQHPVPQPITSYEFRLVGDMTLKQFGKLASGVIFALIVYAINPPGLIKWLLIPLFAGLGAIMAFVPFEGRPVDTWIIAFFKRIYSPTQYIWQQKTVGTSRLIKPQKVSTLPVSPPPVATKPTPEPIKEASPLLDTSVQKTVSPPTASKVSPLLGINLPPPFPPPKTKPKAKSVEANFNPAVVIPATPSMPNLIVGYVRTKEGKIVEGAILEVRDSDGNPVRAFKTNQLGQFLSATPLHNGTYEIETTKEGIDFDIIKVNLEGKIVPPIEIVSK